MDIPSSFVQKITNRQPSIKKNLTVNRRGGGGGGGADSPVALPPALGSGPREDRVNPRQFCCFDDKLAQNALGFPLIPNVKRR